MGARVLRFGDNGAAVVKVQRMLHVTPDGDFGPITQNAVMKFQRKHHLAVDGIVGPKTVTALDRAEHKKEREEQAEHDENKEAHKQAKKRDQGDRDDDDDDKHDGTWSPAPKLADVQRGDATLHLGQKGGSVRHVQKLLGVETDGLFGSGTRSAVRDFQDERDMKVQNGVIDDHVLRVLERHPAGSVEGESRQGAAQRMRMLSVARAGGAGRPDGACYYHVCHFFISCGGYGKIKNPYDQFPTAYLPEARHFAELMNATGAKKWGLERLSMDNPYDAPAGAIVVVAAGSPGTAHPTAGDIAVADGNGRFYNGGLMGYSGRAGWDAAPRARMLGVYIPL